MSQPRVLQGFVKQILDVADNLERASEAVPAAALSSDDAVDLQKQLLMLLEGVQMTQRVLNHVRPSLFPLVVSRHVSWGLGRYVAAFSSDETYGTCD